MLATSIDLPPLPPTWYSVVEQIKAAVQPPKLVFPERIRNSYGYVSGTSSTVIRLLGIQNNIDQLGWSAIETLETHLRLRSFAEDWNAPGMEAYDAL